MGYEVLDSRGEATSRPDDAALAAVDVVDLGALPHPVDEPLPAPWPVVRQRLTAAVSSVIKAPMSAKRVAVLVVAALAIGAVVSGVVVRRHDYDQQRLAQNAVLSVNAVLHDFSPGDFGANPMATVIADLKNYGPSPVRVVTTPDGQLEGVRVRLVSTPPEVAPGGTARVSLSVPVDCDGPGADPTFTVPLLTGDQRRHAVPVELNGVSVRSVYCDRGHSQDVQAAVVGSISRPLLRLTNDSDRAKVLVVRADQEPVATVPGPLVTITTLPAGPVDVPAGRSVDLRLQVSARECPRELAAIASFSSITVAEINRDGSSSSAMGVDVGALVGAAVVRACAKR